MTEVIYQDLDHTPFPAQELQVNISELAGEVLGVVPTLAMEDFQDDVKASPADRPSSQIYFLTFRPWYTSNIGSAVTEQEKKRRQAHQGNCRKQLSLL